MTLALAFSSLSKFSGRRACIRFLHFGSVLVCVLSPDAKVVSLVSVDYQ